MFESPFSSTSLSFYRFIWSNIKKHNPKVRSKQIAFMQIYIYNCWMYYANIQMLIAANAFGSSALSSLKWRGSCAKGQCLRAPSSRGLLVSSLCPTSFLLRCQYGQQGKGPGEEWSYGSKKGRGGEKAKERDGMDYPAPELAYFPSVGIWTAVSVCPMSW